MKKENKSNRKPLNVERITMLAKKIQDQLPFADPPDNEEMDIIISMMDTLHDNKVDIGYDDVNRPRVITLEIRDENRYLPIEISVADHKVKMKAFFPPRVQHNALAITALYINEFNSDSICRNTYAVSYLALDIYSGEVSMNFSFLVRAKDEFNSDVFLRYLYILVESSLNEYTVLSNLAVCMLPGHLKHKYMALMNDSKMVVPNIYRETEKYGYKPDDHICEETLGDKLFKYMEDNPVYIREKELKTAGFIDLGGSSPKKERDEGGDLISFFADTEEKDMIGEEENT